LKRPLHPPGYAQVLEASLVVFTLKPYPVIPIAFGDKFLVQVMLLFYFYRGLKLAPISITVAERPGALLFNASCNNKCFLLNPKKKLALLRKNAPLIPKK